MRKKKVVEKKYDLNEVDGAKFKNMWSTKILYIFLYAAYMTFIVICGGILINHGKFVDASETMSSLGVVLFVILISSLLKFINDKFIGKTVAVTNSKGIYTDHIMIPWSSVKAIKYNTILPTKSIHKESIYCSISIFTSSGEHKILHAPRKMVREIKKQKQGVEVKRDTELICMMLCPFICVIIFYFKK